MCTVQKPFPSNYRKLTPSVMSSPKSLRRGSSNEASKKLPIASPLADTAEPNSFSDMSVHSDCDRARSQASSLDLDSVTTAVGTSYSNYRTTEVEKRRPNAPLFDARHPDFVQFYGERNPGVSSFPESSLTWEPLSEVCEVMTHGRQPCFDKHSERVVPNPWRRFGTLVKLAAVGGWSSKRKKNQYSEVQKNSTLPPAPNTIQMTVHRDPKHPLNFDYPDKSISSDVGARMLALQVASRVETSWISEPWLNKKRIHNFEALFTRFKLSQKQLPETFGTRMKQRARNPSPESTCTTAVSGRFSTPSSSSASNTSTASDSTPPTKSKKGK